jgi:hypothetical protein
MNSLVRLTDIQLVLLATAAQRDNGSLLPPPETLGEGPARIRKAVESLIRRGLAEEVDLNHEGDAWRTVGKRSIGVVITQAGREAIAVEPDKVKAPITEPEQPALVEMEGGAHAPSDDTEPSPAPAPAATSATPIPAPAAHTKTALILQMLGRESGATLDELTGATSWLPHTTRAALTGLRKKGHGIDRRKRGEVTCYHLPEQA